MAVLQESWDTGKNKEFSLLWLAAQDSIHQNHVSHFITTRVSLTDVSQRTGLMMVWTGQLMYYHGLKILLCGDLIPGEKCWETSSLRETNSGQWGSQESADAVRQKWASDQRMSLPPSLSHAPVLLHPHNTIPMTWGEATKWPPQMLDFPACRNAHTLVSFLHKSSSLGYSVSAAQNKLRHLTQSCNFILTFYFKVIHYDSKGNIVLWY